MKTKNYELFSFVKTNRKINEGLVKRLIKSINEIGYVEGRPIIVNESMIIIDGQHRFEACKRLQLPIFYEFSKADINKTILLLNMNQQIWRLNEYVEHWAKSGIECYKSVLQFEETYHFGISCSITICLGCRNNANHIRQGVAFPVNSKRHEIANFILKCKLYFDFYKTHKFVESIYLLFKRTTPENCKKVLDNIQILKQQANTSNYLAVYENIINKNKRESNKITLQK